MSETFYIKKTAFDDNNFDLAQREADSFIIGPGELNGPGGVAQDSDLELYGFGAIKWGEGVNQNQYRLMESNACPEKVAGDFLVGTDDPNGFVPGTGSFVPVAGQPIPKDQYDLGTGNGITAPLIGQIWYNSTTEVLYNFELSGWETVFKEVTDFLNAHIADMSVHLTSDQNTLLDGLNLPTLTSTDINQLVGITTIDGTVQDQIDLMVDSRGDTMTGNLNIINSTDHATLTLEASVVSKVAMVVFNDYLANQRGRLIFSSSSGDLEISTLTALGALANKLTLRTDGNVSLVGGANTPTQAEHLTRKDYVDTKAPILSPTLTGIPRSTTPPNNDDSTRIATTAFVKQTNTLSDIRSVAVAGYSTSLWLPPGEWYVEATARLHQAVFVSLTLLLDGTVVDSTPYLGDPAGTSYVPLFGSRITNGNKWVDASFNSTYNGGWPSSANAGQRIKITAWKINL